MTQLNVSARPAERVSRTFPPKRKAPFPVEFYRSPVGRKWVMAVTGIMLLGYVLVHMVGNLHLYEGPEEVNSYGEALRDLGGDLAPRTAVLWLLRLGLSAAFVLHIHAAYTLALHNRKARPQGYQGSRDYLAANFASRSMKYTGTILVLYLGYHLADLTWGSLSDDHVRGDVYHNVVNSFDNPVVAAFYVAANIALAVHIFHGAWSLFQTLGANSPRYNGWRRSFAGGFAGLILLGNLSFPIAVQLGVISEDERCWPSPAQTEVLAEAGASKHDVEVAIDEGVCFYQLDRSTDPDVEQLEQIGSEVD